MYNLEDPTSLHFNMLIQSRFDKVLVDDPAGSEVNDCWCVVSSLIGSGMRVGQGMKMIIWDDMDVMQSCLQNVEVVLDGVRIKPSFGVYVISRLFMYIIACIHGLSSAPRRTRVS
jgi:hypothetical protein